LAICSRPASTVKNPKEPKKPNSVNINSEINKPNSDDGFSEHLRRKRSAWRRWRSSEENTGKERDDICDAMITLANGIIEQFDEVSRASFLGRFYKTISEYTPKLRSELMSAVLKDSRGWEPIGIRKGLAHLNRGYKKVSEHLYALTEEDRTNIYDKRFALLSGLYGLAHVTSFDEFSSVVLEYNGLDREHDLGVIHDMFESVEILAPTTIITSKHSAIGSGTFMGFRFYKSLREFLQAEVAHAIGYEIDAHNNYDEQINYEIFNRVIFEASCLLKIWEGREVGLDCCSAALEIFSAFEYLDFFGICTLGSYLKEASSIDGWSSPLDRLETRDFEFLFGIPLSGFDWNNTDQIEWLKENLKESYDGI
jgi:hypothetical protein